MWVAEDAGKKQTDSHTWEQKTAEEDDEEEEEEEEVLQLHIASLPLPCRFGWLSRPIARSRAHPNHSQLDRRHGVHSHVPVCPESCVSRLVDILELNVVHVCRSSRHPLITSFLACIEIQCCCHWGIEDILYQFSTWLNEIGISPLPVIEARFNSHIEFLFQIFNKIKCTVAHLTFTNSCTLRNVISTK